MNVKESYPGQGSPIATDASIALAPAFQRRRFLSIDLARGLALLAMAIYHFTWDLEFFGYVEPGLTADGGWKLFARSIASSFLFLAGVSLVLAHYPVLRWRKFFKRLAVIAVAALAISLATLYATPDRWIFFGILHSIAAGYLIGTAFLGFPPALTALSGLIAIVLPQLFSHPVFDQPLLLWTGLGTASVQSNDYVPIFPWIGPLLLGIAAARWIDPFRQQHTLLDHAPGAEKPFGKLLCFWGRHSLTFYLLHQPLLIALVWTLSQMAPPPAEDRAASYDQACIRQCVGQATQAQCEAFCPCTRVGMEDAGIFDAYNEGKLSVSSSPQIASIVQSCGIQTPD